MGASGTDPYSRGAGAATDATLRVVLASDSGGTASLTEQQTQTARLALLATEAKQPSLGTAGVPSADVISVQGFGYTGTSTITRAANATPYSIGDVVGGALTIANIGPSAGEILINAIRIMLNITALPAGMTTFTLHLFDVTPPSAIADNSPFTLASGDRSAYLGKITGITAAAEGIGTQSVVARLENIVQQFKIASGAQLFAYLVTDSAFTPAANSETYSFKAKSIAV